MPNPSRLSVSALVLVCLTGTTTALGQTVHHQPAPGYTLELELRPFAPFPLLKRLGTADLVVYPGGVRADTDWLDGFSLAGSNEVTIENPITRLYAEVPISAVGDLVRRLARPKGEAMPVLEILRAEVAHSRGTVKGIPATRHRIVLGPSAWIDVWTTSTIVANPQFERLEREILRACSPAAAGLVSRIPGVPIYVEINTTRHRKVPILVLKSLVRSVQGADEALKRRKFLVKTDWIENLLDQP